MKHYKNSFEGYSPIIGYDHEFLVLDRKGYAFPSTLIFPLQDSAIIPQGHTNSCLYTDGRQAEHGSKSATSCREWNQDNIWWSLKEASRLVDAYNVEHKTHLAIALCDGAPMRLPAIMKGGRLCMMSGCNPDYDAYKVLPNPGMVNYRRHPFAYAGAHYHIAWTKETRSECFANVDDWCNAVKVYDRIAGIPLVLTSSDNKFNIQRREHYGAAGCHRVPQGRIEWRVPGADSYRSPALVSLLSWCLRLGYNVIVNGASKGLLSLISDEEIATAINTNNRTLAWELYRRMADTYYYSDNEDSPFYVLEVPSYLNRNLGKNGGIVPAACFEMLAQNIVQIDDNWGKHWDIGVDSDDWECHGDTANGFSESMYWMLLGDKEYKKFLLTWETV